MNDIPMKARMLLTLILSLGVILAIPQIADAQMGGPMSGPGSGPGPVDDDDPGPRWEQETTQHMVEKGLMFRYGHESPESSIEGEETGEDISLKVTGVHFKNDTEELEIDAGSEEWTVTETSEESSIQATYTANARWRKDGEQTGETSNIMIKYAYRTEGTQRNLEYSIQLDNPPGEGTLSVEMKASTFQESKACCWQNDGGSNPGGKKRELTLESSEGKPLSRFRVDDKGTIETPSGQITAETEMEGILENESAVVNIAMSLPEVSNSAYFSGSIEIFEELYNVLSMGIEDTAKFIADHIYSFLIGAVVLGALLTGAFLVASRKGKETRGDDLDLNKNRYYRGPQ
jgi:hypothetical protein